MLTTLEKRTEDIISDVLFRAIKRQPSTRLVNEIWNTAYKYRNSSNCMLELFRVMKNWNYPDDVSEFAAESLIEDLNALFDEENRRIS